MARRRTNVEFHERRAEMLNGGWIVLASLEKLAAARVGQVLWRSLPNNLHHSGPQVHIEQRGALEEGDLR